MVEDDPVLSELMWIILQRNGYQVTTARNGEEALRVAGSEPVHLVILDIMLPGIDGWEVCDRIRQRSEVPILMVTALDEPRHQIRGFSLGADGYLSKPFDSNVLLAQVQALLRRFPPEARPPQDVVEHPGLRVDPECHRVEVDGQIVDLTPKEFDLLYLLASNPGRTFSTAEIMQRIWRQASMEDVRTVRVHAQRIRRKLGNAGEYIRTVWGIGYCFEVDR